MLFVVFVHTVVCGLKVVKPVDFTEKVCGISLWVLKRCRDSTLYHCYLCYMFLCCQSQVSTFYHLRCATLLPLRYPRGRCGRCLLGEYEKFSEEGRTKTVELSGERRRKEVEYMCSGEEKGVVNKSSVRNISCFFVLCGTGNLQWRRNMYIYMCMYVFIHVCAFAR